MKCILFNNYGKIKKCTIKRMRFLEFQKYISHNVLSNFTIYHENKPGPFIKKGDSIFPKWIGKYKNKTDLELEIKKFNRL